MNNNEARLRGEETWLQQVLRQKYSKHQPSIFFRCRLLKLLEWVKVFDFSRTKIKYPSTLSDGGERRLEKKRWEETTLEVRLRCCCCCCCGVVVLPSGCPRQTVMHQYLNEKRLGARLEAYQPLCKARSFLPVKKKLLRQQTSISKLVFPGWSGLTFILPCQQIRCTPHIINEELNHPQRSF